MNYTIIACFMYIFIPAEEDAQIKNVLDYWKVNAEWQRCEFKANQFVAPPQHTVGVVVYMHAYVLDVYIHM